MGRVAATACLSDLAACGVLPTQIMQSITWPRDFSLQDKIKLQESYSKELEKHNVHLTGGDTSEGPFVSITSMAQSLTSNPPLTRYGAKPGDSLVLIGDLGDGPSLAISYLLGLPSKTFPEEAYKPEAYLQEGQTLREFATSCIDTSDGLITSLNHLKNINNIDFEIDIEAAIYSKNSINFISNHNIHKLILWIVEHGDYQLLATIPPSKIEELKSKVPKVSIIGKVRSAEISTFKLSESSIKLNLTSLSKNLYERRDSPQTHLKELNEKLNQTGEL
jgi:thiamine-monophosphate kinase